MPKNLKTKIECPGKRLCVKCEKSIGKSYLKIRPTNMREETRYYCLDCAPEYFKGPELSKFAVF